MAEAILFGHRALQPLIDIQEQLREAVGKPKRTPYLEPGTGSVLDFVEAVDAKREFAIVDVETTGTDPKMSDLLEIARRQGQGRQDQRPLVDVRQAVASRSSATRCTASPTRTSRRRRRRPRPPSRPSTFIGDALVVGHNVDLRPRLPRGGRRRPRIDAGPLPRHPDDRPRGLSGPPELQAATRSPAFFGIELDPEPPRPAGRRGDRQPPDLVRERPAGPDRDPQERASPTRVRANRTSKDEAKTKLEAARRKARVSKNLYNLVYKKTCRALALDEGIRMDGRGDDRAPPDLRRGRAPAARPRLGPLHPRRDAGADDRDARRRPRTSSGSTRSARRPRRSTSTTTTSRPIRTGENKPMRGPSRRDIGHGNLAERALIPVLPAHDEFPYVIRLVSECLSLERLDLDGLDLRLDPRPDGRRRADLGSGRRRGDGPDQRAGRPVRRPDRHPRQGGLGRRHGLQGHRHP